MTKTTEQKKTSERDMAIRSAIEKIVVNAGVGRASQLPNFAGTASGGDKGILAQVRRDLALLAGQATQIRPARKSIAGFKIREGQVVGLKTTLRNRKMVDFFERLIRIVLPRVHDFRGVRLHSVDEGGALNIGFREQLVFPEINPEESPFTFPLGVTIVAKKKDAAAAREAYRALGMPFEKEGESQVVKRKKRKKNKKNK